MKYFFKKISLLYHSSDSDLCLPPAIFHFFEEKTVQEIMDPPHDTKETLEGQWSVGRGRKK